MIEIKSCPICEGSSFSDVFKASYFRGKAELFQIQECDSCKLWVTNPRPEGAELEAYYESEDYVSHTDKKETLVDKVYHMVRSFAVKSKLGLVNKHNTEKGNLLDYGAGTGFFLASAKKNGWNVHGVEPSAEARKNAKEANGVELHDPEKYDWTKKAHLDCISMWHVLEHLPELNRDLQNFTDALKPGGCLIIAVPNHESEDAKHYKEDWAALDVPLHLWHFKKRNLQAIADKFNYDLVDIQNMPFDAFYVSMLSEKNQTGKVNYPKAFLTGLSSNIKGSSAKNQSSLIYVLRKRK
jgi:2-polyprenyl-3-methyl-5-hydroxy-6-metoxy-1,4-benzoquinol methylase